MLLGGIKASCLVRPCPPAPAPGSASSSGFLELLDRAPPSGFIGHLAQAHRDVSQVVSKTSLSSIRVCLSVYHLFVYHLLLICIYLSISVHLSIIIILVTAVTIHHLFKACVLL